MKSGACNHHVLFVVTAVLGGRPRCVRRCWSRDYELCSQDFALEADEGQMRAGAHLIAGSLSGSLALATGKEPLRSALTTQLRAMLHNRLPGPELEAAIAVSCIMS